MGSLPEFRQAQRRVADGTVCGHTEPAYVPGGDPREAATPSSRWCRPRGGPTLFQIPDARVSL